MRRSRKQQTSHRGQDQQHSSSYGNRAGGFEQTGSGYRYEDQQRRTGNENRSAFGGSSSGYESWRQPAERSRYSEGRETGFDYDRESRFGRGYEGRSGASSRDWGEQQWTRGGYGNPGYDEQYEPQEMYGGGEGYQAEDYSHSRRGAGEYPSQQDWSSRTRGSYGQGPQQYGQSSSHEPWAEGSYQGRERGVTQGRFGQGSEGRRNQSQGSGMFAGRGPQGYKRSDERITEDVNEALTRDADIDPTNVQVEVRNGEVILKGSVSDREAKRRAEDIAESCSGVKEVQNQLRVKREEESSETSDTSNKRRQQMAS